MSAAYAPRARLLVRVRILCALFILVALLLITRLYFVQIVHGDMHRQSAEGQYVQAASDIQSRREIRFTRHTGEEVAAAIMQTGWRVAIHPAQLEDSAHAYEMLRGVVQIDEERFYASAAKIDDPYEEVAFRVSDSEAAAVRALKLPGVTTVRDEWRMYPAAELAAQTIGFVGYRGERRAGVYGLERYYEDTLKRADSKLYVNPFAEIFANVQAALASDPAAHEGDIITSIEPAVQTRLEDTLRAVMESFAPRMAGGIVMEPSSGRIIALAIHPTFDPNTFNTVEDQTVFSNPLVESVYEMGSIMKPLTIAAAIDAGAITPNTTYEDRGFVIKSGKRISNYDGRARGVVDMQQVLGQSLNTGVSFAVDRMGKETFARYIEALGLGEETGIDLPNEAAGNIRALAGSVDVDYASASFGQGIAFTPIAMVRALATLANGGALPEPHIATAVRYPSGIVRPLARANARQVFSPETATQVTDMLVTVYDESLLGGELKVERYSIAAKTGTAQIANPHAGGYYADRYLHSFFGYFPAHEPRFIVLLYAIEPKREIYASATLARPFSALADFLIRYYEIPPDR
ncbi:hypothetical protein COU20_03160 [Candidatus Kaiserbacteria bacterium CG10_big_fil_rev_8_21_14_0_10_59_10]|uniref:Penicillin-binding protein transpeptidase domain-containing protein n=1 Tax=Candidatus Kaiserbacteria bacterium CG10_big_fil_rev_8_21_14_0_10_59_10 TaxID=1974612 RepID=A0A2H0U787_9BACT|nr:MAG: hypothetical protein COU20_03160 [Candidatus Kaiserbacteria bacterium CG10_big_fil_rev_8_21_14_0_10_59_10]